MEMDAKKCKFLPVTVLGRPGLFHSERIERASVPKGWHMYEIQYHPKNPKLPVQIGKMAVNHFYGTVLTPKAIRLSEGEWDFRVIHGNRDLRFSVEKAVTLKEYDKQKHRGKHGR